MSKWKVRKSGNNWVLIGPFTRDLFATKATAMKWKRIVESTEKSRSKSKA